MEISQSSFSIFPYPFSKSSFVLYFVKSVGNRGDDFQLTVTYTTKQKKVAEFDGNNPFVLSLTSETKLPNFTNIRSFALEARSPGGPMKIAQTEFIINVSVTDLKVLRYRHYNATERQQLVNIVENLVRGTASNETVRCIPMRVDVETPISNQSPVRSRGTIKIACMGVERLDLVSQAIEKQRKIISMKLFSTNRLLFSAHATFTTMSPECFAMTPRPGSSDKFWRFDICGQAQDKKCVRTLCDEGLPCSTHQDCISAFCDPKKIDPQWGARPFSFPALLSSISTFNDQEGICRDANYRPDEGTETSDDGDGSDSSDGTDKDTKPGSLYKILLIITGSIVLLLVSMYVYYRLNLYCQRYKMRRRQDEELRERMLDDEIEYDRYQYNEQDLVDYYDVFKSGT